MSTDAGQAGRRLRERAVAAAVLGCAYGLSNAYRYVAASRPQPPRRAAAAAVAGAGPLLLIGGSLARGGQRLRVPASGVGLVMLGGYLASGVLAEELLWRAPLTFCRTRRSAACVAMLSSAGFVGLHVRRDGLASAPVHAVNTASWTASVVFGRRLRWPMLSHFLYNCLAVSLRRVESGPVSRRPS
jgi:membrane protease YdiL (CAAX protease family)